MSNELKFIDLVDRAAQSARAAKTSDMSEMESLHEILAEIVREVDALEPLDKQVKDQTADAAQTACSLVETMLKANLEGSSESLDAVCKTVDTIHDLAMQIQGVVSDSDSAPSVETQATPTESKPAEAEPEEPTPEQLAESEMVITTESSEVEEPKQNEPAQTEDSAVETQTSDKIDTPKTPIETAQETTAEEETVVETQPEPEPETEAKVEDVTVEESLPAPDAAEETQTEPQAAVESQDPPQTEAKEEKPAEPEAKEQPEAVVEAEPEGQETVQGETAEQSEEECQDTELDEDDLPLVMDFITEAAEHIENAEAGLLEVESAPDDSEAINRIFRAFHTVKGMAGFLNLLDIGSLAHSAENLLDLGRKGEIQLVGTNMDVIFESVDLLKVMMGALQKAAEGNGVVVHNPDLGALLVKLKAAAEGEAQESAPAEAQPAKSEPQASVEETAPAQQAENKEVPQPEQAAAEEPAPVEEPETQTVTPEAVETKSVQEEEPKSQAEPEAKPEPIKTESAPAKAEKTDEPPKPAAKAAEAKPTPAAKPAAETKPAAKPAGNAPAGKKQAVSDEKIKVSTQRLDSLVNMVGELVIAQSMVAQGIQSTDISQDHGLTAKINHQSKIVRELQELSMMMRMVPIQGVFQKMARLVRDLSQKSGKKVDFHTEGEDTELDRIVVDQIADPLVHMIRNSVDHGIESAEDRAAAGKPATGVVKLRAFHQAGNIVIEIIDDGKGLDKEKLLKKAINNGIITEQSDLTDQEIYKLIFHAGFSTAEKVTDISGRGVGMDVVKKNIESLRGKIEIQSELGKGTTFTIRLPLTMAIIDGQIVRIGTQRYIIPIVSIECCIRPTESQISTVAGKGEMAMVQGTLVPMVRLYKLFGVDPDSELPHESSLVVVEEDGKKGSLVVDELLGQQQVVIKSLGAGIGRVRGISGGAIMGDGRVSLIIDVPGLLESAWERKNSVSSMLV